MQPDSIIPNLTNPQSLNRYGYVQNNPVRFNDPTGHVPVCNEDDGDICEHEPAPTSPIDLTTSLDDGSGGSGNHCNNDPDCLLGGDSNVVIPETSRDLTDIDKVGIALTAVMVDVIVAVFELSLIGFQIILLDMGPLGVIIDVAIFPFEFALGDFGVSFALMAVEEIDTGQTQEFKWIFIPALFSSLPAHTQRRVLENIPDPLYKILTNKNP